ncbi:unnamed protein product [Protopolystoma xenopodis]|uniref:Uncharacterized protein n=1 Tax=Protopolystoma xenopodis TaxID=117903 RepID=A0A448XCE4_9PLAT|nr:unnamed protein product [Protopolystoma xenopodis]
MSDLCFSSNKTRKSCSLQVGWRQLLRTPRTCAKTGADCCEAEEDITTRLKRVQNASVFQSVPPPDNSSSSTQFVKTAEDDAI